MFALGCTIYGLYDEKPPGSVKPIWAKLVAKIPTGRPDPKKVITAPAWKKSPYIQAQLFFENAALITDHAQKEKFYSELVGNLSMFPETVSHHKVIHIPGLHPGNP